MRSFSPARGGIRHDCEIRAETDRSSLSRSFIVTAALLASTASFAEAGSEIRAALTSDMAAASSDCERGGKSCGWSEPIPVQAGQPFEVENVAGIAGRPVLLDIDLPLFAASDYMLLSFRKLPDGFSLSSGFSTKDAWLVSAHKSNNLQLIPPENFTGEFDFEVQLIRGENLAPVVKTVRAAIRPPELAEPDASRRTDVVDSLGPAASPDLGPDPAVRALPAAIEVKENVLDPAKEKRLMMRARSLLDQNDISAARLIYRRLAIQGSAQGALILAQTYDPAFLSQYAISGLQPSAAKARKWYEYAARLGKNAPTRHQGVEERGGQ